jgi:hypothetical protein
MKSVVVEPGTHVTSQAGWKGSNATSGSMELLGLDQSLLAKELDLVDYNLDFKQLPASANMPSTINPSLPSESPTAAAVTAVAPVIASRAQEFVAPSSHNVTPVTASDSGSAELVALRQQVEQLEQSKLALARRVEELATAQTLV